MQYHYQMFWELLELKEIVIENSWGMVDFLDLSTKNPLQLVLKNQCKKILVLFQNSRFSARDESNIKEKKNCKYFCIGNEFLDKALL